MTEVTFALLTGVMHPDRRDLRFGQNGHAQPLRQVEVVPVQGVLGAHPASRHAGAAEGAPRAPGPAPLEVRILHRHPGFAEEDAHPGGFQRLAQPHVSTHLLEDLVRPGPPGIGRGAQHPARCGVVGLELRLPVRQVAPGGGLEEGPGRGGKGVAVDEGPASHADAVEHGHILQEGDAEEPAASDPRRPDPPAQVPVGPGEVPGRKSAPLLEDQDPVALLGQAERGHAPAKP